MVVYERQFKSGKEAFAYLNVVHYERKHTPKRVKQIAVISFIVLSVHILLTTSEPILPIVSLFGIITFLVYAPRFPNAFRYPVFFSAKRKTIHIIYMGILFCCIYIMGLT